jgi:putative membrane-bound dehydrogenase-like protein
MRRSLLILPGICALSAFTFAADLKPDATTDIPDSAKRPAVVKLDKSQASNLQSQMPKAILPDGMELQLVAAAPLVTHPIMGCLDNRGRLFVGDATGVNWNKAQLEKNPPNRVLMLEDTDKDGVFDKSTIFADKMTFPQGACWLDGSLYVASPPSIWKLTDTDNDGVADKREEIVTGFEYTGNAADIHGPFLHPNGRLYWCHGRKGHVVKQKDGTVVHEGLASGIWSCKPDGSDVQWHSLACGDNPVEVDFTPDGDIIGVQNLYYSQPRGDTIVHWLYGGVYERADQMKAIVGLPRTLEHMPVMYNFGHVAVSGSCFAKSGILFPKSPLQFMVTHFNTQRVVRMELTPDGATYKATEHEFLRLPESPDVHFTDVMEDSDGSLLVLDTGGWFRIGCPSSLMAKPDIAGAVYRVKRADDGQTRLVKSGGSGWIMGKPAWQLHDEKEIVSQLESSSPHGQLCACEALAKLKLASPAVHQALLKLLAQPSDATLEHALTYAAMMSRLPALSELKKATSPLLLRRLLVVAENTA